MKLEHIKHPICPINLYFEGDEDKCDTAKCDFDTETRSCAEICIIQKGDENIADRVIIGNPKKQFGHPDFYKLLNQMADLHSRKNHDYAGTKDPLKNLRACKRLNLKPFLGVVVRLQDKWSRLEEFVNSEQLMVKDESVIDTLMDNAVYSLLAIILYREEQKECLMAGLKSDARTAIQLQQNHPKCPYKGHKIEE